MKQTPANKEYQKLRAKVRCAYRVSDLPQPFVDALSATRMSPAYDHLNAMLDDKDYVPSKGNGKSGGR